MTGHIVYQPVSAVAQKIRGPNSISLSISITFVALMLTCFRKYYMSFISLTPIIQACSRLRISVRNLGDIEFETPSS